MGGEGAGLVVICSAYAGWVCSKYGDIAEGWVGGETFLEFIPVFR
jgi:hypothetical protein